MLEHTSGTDRPTTLITRGAVTALWRDTEHASDLGVPDATDRTAWDRVSPRAREALLAAADAERGKPWPDLLLRHWSAFGASGSRLAYEDPFFARSERTRRAVLAATVAPSEERVREAADGLWLLCEQSSWCWPAHDESFRGGRAATDVAVPVVDLGAGEAAALVAWADILLGPLFDAHLPGLRDRLRRETTRRVLSPFLARDWAWETRDPLNNWAPWIHGNLLVAASAFADDARRDEIADRCVDGIDRYLAEIPADGAVDEGFAYWWQGAGRALDALAILDHQTNGRVARAAGPGGSLAGLAELVRFPERVHLGGDWYASWSDAEARAAEPLPWHALFRAATLCDVPTARGFAAAHGDLVTMLTSSSDTQSGLGRQIRALLDPAWADAEGGADPLPAAVELSSIGVGIRREQEGSSRGLALVVKAGHNDESHNQNDLGAIEIAVDGVPLVVDPGRETYTAQTFSPRRYDLWYTGSAWHSTPLPRGLAQDPGADRRADATATRDGWTVDLTHAYPLAADERWVREAHLADGSVTIHDTWSLATGTGTVVLVCVGTPRETDDGFVIAGREGGRDLLLTHDAASAHVETREIADPIMARSWGDALSRIVLDAGPGRTTLEVRATVADGAVR
ncbi:heparinase II/III family protein [Microbacterium sp. G2-8]|uniref:heparinase II/III domain-containing protein n=1 Tax=Microbacterium sp. G2-8 TaxID=2842454 RepID=UPI001C8A75DF|nr:heparinase II/III family protein [Microbacterium sp. G2-8]